MPALLPRLTLLQLAVPPLRTVPSLFTLLAIVLANSAASAAERDDLTPLLQAARGYDTTAALALVAEGADVNVAENDGTTALHWAASAGDRELVTALLAAGADPDPTNRYGLTPLQAAADGGFASAVAALLNAGADPHTVLPEGETVLMSAARSGNLAVLQALLDAGVDTEARDDFYGETALIRAVVEDHADVVAMFAAHGADVDGASTEIDYPTRRAGQSVLGLGRWTPMMYAARENSLAAGVALIKAGANLDRQDPDGATALVIAIINAHHEFAKMLIDAGANPNIGDHEAGMAALYASVDMHRLAVGHGRGTPPPVGLLTALDTARTLLQHGADPNATLKQRIITRTHTIGDTVLDEGATPLLRAAKSGDIAMVRLLVEHGADPFATMPNGTTALHFAAGLGWRNGSPIAPSYDQGPETEAVETIDYLLELGLDVDAQNEDGNSPLHSAVSGRQAHAIVERLLERGADPMIVNASGQTVLSLAEQRSTKAIAELVAR